MTEIETLRAEQKRRLTNRVIAEITVITGRMIDAEQVWLLGSKLDGLWDAAYEAGARSRDMVWDAAEHPGPESEEQAVSHYPECPTPAVCGKPVYCTTCQRAKKPVGRDAGMNNGLCDRDCPGYASEPHPGHLWPSEIPHNVHLDTALRAEVKALSGHLDAVLAIIYGPDFQAAQSMAFLHGWQADPDRSHANSVALDAASAALATHPGPESREQAGPVAQAEVEASPHEEYCQRTACTRIGAYASGFCPEHEPAPTSAEPDVQMQDLRHVVPNADGAAPPQLSGAELAALRAIVQHYAETPDDSFDGSPIGPMILACRAAVSAARVAGKGSKP